MHLYALSLVFSNAKYNQLRNNVNDDGSYVQKLHGLDGLDQSVHLEDYNEC